MEESTNDKQGEKIEITQFKVSIIKENEKSVGYIRFMDNKVELLEVKAEVTPESYISMCFIPPKPKTKELKVKQQRPQLGRFSAFCLSPAHTDSSTGAEHTGETAPKTVSDWTQYLRRHSWNGQDAAGDANSDDPNAFSCQIVWADNDQESLANLLTNPHLQGSDGNVVLKEGAIQTFDFKTSEDAGGIIKRCLQAWSTGGSDGRWLQEVGDIADRDSFVSVYGTSGSNQISSLQKQMQLQDGEQAPEADIVYAAPIHLLPAKIEPTVVENSAILTKLHFSCITNQLPPRYRQGEWNLVYSTQNHGISLHTLYRKVQGLKPLVTVIRDHGGNVFGCFTPETWKVQPRYYGTGETFVFQLLPHMLAYQWDRQCSVSNEYFQYGQQDSLGVGGGPHFAMWIDEELMNGNSGTCNTFGSPCLASAESFTVKTVEVWHID
eukprot:TRINITY_DN2491_c0_g1_i8.p2 TRINITY_DN2491_c0_g1~~TRINITY_DN2491_c0_g1_i8.p2  ORF type:complete len:471 (-),score=52.06 TRINITY_DN2491_c0_g1_i8:948-2255(-)